MISLAEFLTEARAFLDSVAEPKREQAAFEWGVGPDEVTIFEEFSKSAGSDELFAAKRWAAARFDAGFGWVDGPAELGGRGLTADHAAAYRELEAQYEHPNLGVLSIAEGFIAPTILAHGTPELRQRFLPAMYRGDLIVCQLFSEPNAGSDLTAAQTRAVPDGDEWILNGQKVWTSNAQVADVGLAVTRTNPHAPKHKGLTMFLVDMHSPGVEVRPLRQMTGGAGFNEVFLTDVRVPDVHRVGEVDAGFSVIITTLGNERTTHLRSGGTGSDTTSFERVLAVAEHYADRNDPVIRQHLASVYTSQRVIEFMTARMAAQLADGGTPGAEMMILKLASTRHGQKLISFLTDALGPRLIADTGEWGSYSWSSFVLGAPSSGIGGGTNEIVRNRLG